MSPYLLIRFLHISSAIIFGGGLFARQAVRSLTARASGIDSLVSLTEAAGTIERWMVIPGNLLAIVFGLVLAVITRAPLLGSVLGPNRNWLLASMLILVLLLPLVPLVFLPRGKVFEAALQQAGAKGIITSELRAQIADPVVRWAHLAEMIGTGLIVALMVFKPF